MTSGGLGYGARKYGQAIVINTGDKDRAGYYQIRILGLQDSIPDEHLPWARQMTPSASHQKVGRSPTRLLKGSEVMVQYEDPGEMAIIFGAVDRSGLSKEGFTEDGSKQLDPKYNSLPNVCYGNNEEVGNCDKNGLARGRPPDSYEQTQDVLLETPIGS